MQLNIATIFVSAMFILAVLWVICFIMMLIYWTVELIKGKDDIKVLKRDEADGF